MDPTTNLYPTFAPKRHVEYLVDNWGKWSWKTTTIGKIAHIAQIWLQMLNGADTFRAAAVEQVKIWGSRSGIEVIANPGQNTDPAAVVFDAIAAQSRKQNYPSRQQGGSRTRKLDGRTQQFVGLWTKSP